MADTARQWDLGVALGAMRMAIGTSLIVTRGFSSTVLGADRADQVVPASLATFGVRDVALGAATVLATRPGGNVARVLDIAAVNDVIDAAAVGGLVATGRLPRGRGIAVAALSLLVSVADFLLARRAARPAGLTLTG